MFLDELLELVDVVVNWCHNCASCQSLDCKHQKTSTDINRYQTSQKHWSLSKSERASDRSASISPQRTHFGGGFRKGHCRSNSEREPNCQSNTTNHKCLKLSLTVSYQSLSNYQNISEGCWESHCKVPPCLSLYILYTLQTRVCWFCAEPTIALSLSMRRSQQHTASLPRKNGCESMRFAQATVMFGLR
jgi:hypothetical protein